MVTFFQSSKKPVAKAVHVFDETSDAKWVPLNKSFITLVQIVLRAAAERLQVADIAVNLSCITHQGYRHLLLAGEEQDDTISALGAVEEFVISNDLMAGGLHVGEQAPQQISMPINYQTKTLGFMLATLNANKVALGAAKTVELQRQVENSLCDVAKDIVSIIKRYQTRYRAIFIYGDHYYWIGNSIALRYLDKRIEKLEPVSKPILIRGNKGTGKSIAARTLHSLRHKNILPFIESSCDEWQERAAATILQALYSYAKGGTLYLRNVDMLSDINFKALQQFWLEKRNESHNHKNTDSVGLMFSVSRYDYTGQKGLNEWFVENTEELLLPDLVARQEDIRDLVRFYISEHKSSVDIDFTEAAWAVLENVNWQQNVQQLKTVVKELMLVIEEPLIQESLVESIVKDCR